MLLDLFLRLSPLQADFSFGCPVFRRSPIPLPTKPGAAGLHLRLSRFPAVTHPTADMAQHLWTSFSAVTFFGGHPSHRRPSPVLLDLFLRLSPLHVVTHPSADLSWCCWTTSSAIPFPDGHPSHCRPSPVLLDLFLRLSPLHVVTHPSADLDRFSWTSSSAVPFSGGHPSHCQHGPAPNCSHFLDRRYFSNPFSPKGSIHIGKLSQQHYFVMASFVILVWGHIVSPYNWTVQKIAFYGEAVISGKSLG